MPVIFLFAVFAAVNLFFFVCQNKNVLQLLLDRRDAPWISAVDDISDFGREMKPLLFYDFSILDNIDSDIVVDKAKYVKVHKINRAFNLHNILFSHLAAFGIFDNRHTAVQLVQMEVLVYVHAPSGLDVVQYETFLDTSPLHQDR